MLDNTEYWYALKVNPEPWAVGPLGVGRKNQKVFPYMGRNLQLDAYKRAVRSELEAQPTVLVPGEVEVKFWFWRRLESYQMASGKNKQKHEADATNLQKATEDAIQGILIENDRNVKVPCSVIVEQGPEVDPMILIRIREVGDHESEIPTFVWDKISELTPLPPTVATVTDQYLNPEDVF